MSLLKTQLHHWHSSRAKMVPFAGFEMPVVYNSPSNISKEHLSVRNSAGLFDVSHMGRMIVSGEDAVKFLDLLIPRNLSILPLNKVAYCYFLNERGGFRDDITVAQIEENVYLITYNAGNRKKIWLWVKEFEALIKSISEMKFSIENISDSTAMFAFQGPDAPIITKNLFGEFPGPWRSSYASYQGIKLLIMGSGYTGEAGCEIVISDSSNDDPSATIKVWEDILENKVNESILPCGLASRDTLRLEAGMPLYGNDIEENVQALQTGLVFPALVNLEKKFFFGKSAIENNLKNTELPKRVGLVTLTRGRSPRQDMNIKLNNKIIGKVTSGTFSPLLKLGIGMGYIINKENVNEVTLEAETYKIQAKIANFPLFDSDKYGSKRKS